mmetsp:Transcript_2558/g.4365  ORF Transcript_2558/g.4365 Transcript_2558/m.4365 type:complete len:188 (+) Transcript_2558:47-610(+)
MADEKPQEGELEGEGDRPKAILTSRKRPRSATGHVSWDEVNLAEHDKERGTRQKIDEPPTPFARSPATVSEDEASPAADVPPNQAPSALKGLDAEELSRRLNMLEQVQATPDPVQRPAAAPTSPTRSVRSVAFTEGGTPKVSSEAFKAKRAAHYDEFRVLQAFRNAAAAGTKAKEASDEESSGSGKR